LNDKNGAGGTLSLFGVLIFIRAKKMNRNAC